MNKAKISRFSKPEVALLILFSVLFVAMTLATNFAGNTDLKDYTGVAKFFAGKFNADIRTSHSYLYGFLHAPFIKLFENFIAFKITSLLSLFLIIYSAYVISNKDKRVLWLALFAPIVWFMAPWASPIQTSSLLFLWGYYFIRQYDADEKIKYLFYSGLLTGLAAAIWDGAIFFALLLGISFLYNRKIYHGLYFLIFFFIGMLPRLILDQVLFGFAFFGVIRHIFASLTLTLYGGFYDQGSLYGLTSFILALLFIPWFSYFIFKKKIFIENKKTCIFLILAILLLVINSQIRFTLIILPIAIILISKYLTRKQYTSQMVIFLVITLLVVNPYIVQVNNQISIRDFDIRGREIGSIILNYKDIKIEKDFTRDLVAQDLQEIVAEFPNEVFVVGNTDDRYSDLADIYWGNEVKEFVSIQDYNMYMTDDPIIFEKEFCSHTRIASRRDICIAMWMRKAFNDETDYDAIKYGISEEEKIDLEGFVLVKSYKVLNVFEKV